MTLVAIDGPAGAGKTTLATQFYEKFSDDNSVNVVHMDDLYDGWNNALSEQLTQKLAMITNAHKKGAAFQIEIFNWVTMKFEEIRSFEPADILILEGVGAAQLVVREAGATVYWLDISPEIGLARVLARDGNQIEAQMRSWQILQNSHFAADLTRESADHILNSQ